MRTLKLTPTPRRREPCLGAEVLREIGAPPAMSVEGKRRPSRSSVDRRCGSAFDVLGRARPYRGPVDLPISDDAICTLIEDALQADGQYVAHLESDDQKGIERVRAMGRRVARVRAWKVRTVVTTSGAEVHGAGETIVVVVLVGSSPLHEQLLKLRSDRKMRAALDRVWPKSS